VPLLRAWWRSSRDRLHAGHGNIHAEREVCHVRLSRFCQHGLDGAEARIAVASEQDGERWVDVRAAERLRLQRLGASSTAAARIAAATVPGSLTAALEAGSLFLEAAHAAAATADALPDLAELTRLAPVDPPAYRDFMAFPEHFIRAAATRDRQPAEELFELPASYMGSAQAIIGPGAEVAWPAYTDHLDYELELGIVIARGGRNITPERALDHVLGVTVLNDFSARDIQRREMAGGLGPSKAKHFATAVGPMITTLDELNLDALVMRAWVNDELWSEGSTATIMWKPAELIAWASASEYLAAGTLLGTGTVGGGCGLELGRRLSPGDTVRLAIDGIGRLENQVGPRPGSGWQPSPHSSSEYAHLIKDRSAS
jgi:2-keto-4-pentenoate hydratase/2-oxohepta-3-ene-1,7-dioic acid hydratase in catechol pathway